MRRGKDGTVLTERTALQRPAEKLMQPAVSKSVLWFQPGVKQDVQRALIRAVAGVLKASPLRHRMDIGVVPEPAMHDAITGTCCFGVFVKHSARHVSIFVAAGLADEVQREGDTRAAAVEAVVHCFLHEWSHYEQFREGRPLTENGREVRASGLRRLIERT